METPFEAIKRLARINLNSVDGAAPFAEFVLSIPAEDIAEAVKKGIIAGRRHAMLVELAGHERRLLYDDGLEHHKFLFAERYTTVSGGRLLETPEWCVLIAFVLRAVSKEFLIDNSFAHEAFRDNAIEMIGFVGDDDGGVSRLVRSFWRNFFHEAVCDPYTEPTISRNKRLMSGALALYKKVRGNQPVLQCEVGALLAETLHHADNDVHNELLPLFRDDRGFFEEQNVVPVINALTFYDFYERLEIRT
jgi:hypothetical protein